MAYRKSHIPSFQKTAKKITKIVKSEFQLAVTEYGNRKKDEFVDRIERQWFPAFIKHPLSKEWVREKRAAGASEKVMIATKTYKESIVVVQDGDTVYIGIRPDSFAKDLNGSLTDFRLLDLALLHEYGSQAHNIPARPHWTPQWESMVADSEAFAKELADRIATRIEREV